MRIELNKHLNNDWMDQRKAFWDKAPRHLIKNKEYRNDKFFHGFSFFHLHRMLFWICPNCGCELFIDREYEKPYRDFCHEDYPIDAKKRYTCEFMDALEDLCDVYGDELIKTVETEVSNIDVCPLCGETLSKDVYFFQEYYPETASTKEPSVNTKFEQMEKEMFAFLIKGASEKTQALMQSPDIKSYSTSVLKQEITVNLLKDYVFNLLNLETNLLSMSKRLEQLYFKRSQNSININAQRYTPVLGLINKISEKEAAVVSSENNLTVAKNQKLKSPKITYPTRPSEPIYAVPNFFNKKKVLAENERLRQYYESEIRRYEEKVKECDDKKARNIKKAEADKENNIREAEAAYSKCTAELDGIKNKIEEMRSNIDTSIVPAIGEKYLLDKEIAEIEESIKKNLECRNKLYSYNIVFEKYRNIVALSSIYEYLMAGRCTSLEGADGAYNIYESEIRMDRIIDQLDTVITSLDQIKQNQFMIYSKLEEINSSLHRLENTMSKAVTSIDAIKVNTDSMNKYMENISKNTDVIAHNSAVTAYYSKVNAELTNALGFMVALG
ncbi:MAG: hypothetical protein IJB57_02790 [Clostridia bacterium]|nr:hypothetical protein [Clostridia bacterium]